MNNSKIFHNNTYIGTVCLGEGGMVFVDDAQDDSFGMLIESMRSVTIPMDMYNEERQVWQMVKKTISSNDPNYFLALQRYLELQGYRVEVMHPETEAAIRQLLSEFPDDNTDKIDILQRLSEMPYLEQTIILDGLEKIKDRA